MDRQVAGRLLEKEIDALMAEGLTFPDAFAAAMMMNPSQGLSQMARQEAIEVIRELQSPRDPRDFQYPDGIWASDILPYGVTIDQAVRDGTWGGKS